MAGRAHLKDLGRDRHTSDGRDIFEPPGPKAIVNAEVTQKENDNSKAYHEAIRAQISVADTDLPLRPGYGDKGVPVTLLTNYLEVSMKDAQQLFTYEAAFDERIHNKRQRHQFMESVMKSVPELNDLGQGVATDYASLVVTSAKLALGSSESKTFAIACYDTEFPEGRMLARGRPFKLTLSLVGTISSSDLSRYVMSGPPESIDSAQPGPVDAKAVQTLNVVIASRPNKDPSVYQGGQNKFFRYPTDQGTFSNYDLLGGLIAVRGFFSSIRFSTSRTLLNLNTECSPFYKSINARELIQLFRILVPDWLALERFLKGLRVEASYMRAPDGRPIRKARTIAGLSHKMEHDGATKKPSGNAEVDHGNAEQIKFKRIEYGLTLSHPTECVLNCGTMERPVWVPPELCTVIPGQVFRGQLNEVQLARMITIAARPPAENASRIMAEDGGLGLIGVLPNKCDNLAAFGVTVSPQMIAVPGRMLSAPKVIYSGNSTARTAGGSWNMRDKKVWEPATLSEWTILRIGAAAKTDLTDFEPQCKALTAGLRSCGLKVNPPQVFPGPCIPSLSEVESKEEISDKKAFVDSKLREVFEGCMARKVTMLLVVLPSTKPWIRERVKFWGEKVYGIHSNCIQMDQLRKQDPNYFANVALKINLKLGGRNQCLSTNDLGFLRHGKTMLVGIDVTHPAPGTMRGIPSIAGVVASVDANFGQWPGNICCQESKKEMVTHLETMMEERLKSWISKNPGQKLENVIVYRDGVSESQYMTVRRVEIPAIRSACERIFQDTAQPKITFLVVGKHHHTRFYPTDKKQSDQKHNCNIQNGTVVDRGITMEKGWDFYMAAHTALQGTTKPAHYVVLLDEIRLNANDLERLTHNFCYLQGRATKAVSVCPPAYYAHLICLRARCYLAEYIGRNPRKDFDWDQAPWRSGVHERLKDSMFYI